MKRGLILLVIVFIGLCGFLPAYAQDVSPTPEPGTRADNECYTGGTMAGKCDRGFHADGSVTPADIAWAWRCGWYMARFNDGMLTRPVVPSDCGTLLPGIDSDLPFCIVFTFLGKIDKACLQGNILSEDADNDGIVDARAYIIANSIVGNAGICPAGIPYVADISSYVSLPTFTSFIYSRGYKATDDLCGPIP